MQHPFTTLKPEYAQLLQMMKVRPERQALVDSTAKRLCGLMDRYTPVTKAIGVPEIFIATSFEREASSNFKLNPAQGWPLNSTSKWIPHNGPFRTWQDAAIAAYKLNGLDKVGAGNWTWELICFYGEMFNGFGYRDYHRMHTPYLWAWTNIQAIGKYDSDGHFDPGHWDEQMGTIPVARRMVELMPELAVGGTISPTDIPAPRPSGIAEGVGTEFVQHALNELGFEPALVEDGNYGKKTMRAVEQFQRSYGLTVDGLAGPETIGALKQAVSAKEAA